MSQEDFEADKQAAFKRYRVESGKLDRQQERLRRALNKEIIALMDKHSIKNAAVEFLLSGGEIRYYLWDDGYDSYQHYETIANGAKIFDDTINKSISEALSLELLIKGKNEKSDDEDNEEYAILLNPRYFKLGKQA